jgi:polyhydroxyalkanoate synthesis regulator phasin
MPKKKLQETQEEQSKRFRQTVRDLVAAGELNPTEADSAMEKVLKAGTQKRLESSDSSDLD